MSDASDAEAKTSPTIGELLQEYLETLSPEDHNTAGVYVRKYVEHVGHDFPVELLTGARVELYAESQIKPSDPAAPERVSALKAWFQFLKKRSHTEKNLGIHIRVRKPSGRARRRGAGRKASEAREIQMTPEGIETLEKELKDLTGNVPDLVQAITRAREDKDVRENAPLDAAREALAFNDQRRRQIEETLKRAVAVDASSVGRGASSVGSVVTVKRLDNDMEISYKLVGAREANASEKKISVESPVGRQLLGRNPGDHVSVETPSGVLEFEVRSVD